MKKLLFILLLVPFSAMAEDIAVNDSSKTLGELSARITALEEENRKLYGKIEELEYNLDKVSKRAESMQVKQDYYLTKPGDTSSEYVIRVDSEEEGILDENGENIPFKKAASSEEEAKFNEAFAHIGKQDYAAAKEGFDSFIAEEPSKEYLAQSYFWLGEISQKENKKDVAAVNYLKSYKADPEGKRASESLIKLVENLSELGKEEQACKNLARFNEEFPNEHFNLKEKAKTQSAKLKCE